jgi:hypothetical protein
MLYFPFLMARLPLPYLITSQGKMILGQHGNKSSGQLNEPDLLHIQLNYESVLSIAAS